MKSKQQNKQKPKKVKIYSMFEDNPTKKQRATNRNVFEILMKLQKEQGKPLSFYFRGDFELQHKGIGFSNGRKLVLRMKKDKLIKLKKDKFNTLLFITDEGLKWLNKLLQQPCLKE